MFSTDVRSFLEALRVDAKRLREDPNLAGKVQQYVDSSFVSNCTSGTAVPPLRFIFSPLATPPSLSVSWSGCFPNVAHPAVLPARCTTSEILSQVSSERVTEGTQESSHSLLGFHPLGTVNTKEEVQFENPSTGISAPLFHDPCSLSAVESEVEGGSTQNRTTSNPLRNTTAQTPYPTRFTDAFPLPQKDSMKSGVTAAIKNPPEVWSSPVSTTCAVTSSCEADPLGEWRGLLSTSIPLPSYSHRDRFSHPIVFAPPSRQTEKREEIVKERAIRDYLRRLLIFTCGYDDPTASSSATAYRGKEDANFSSPPARSPSGSLMWFEDALYNGTALSELIQTVLSRLTLQQSKVHKTMTSTIPSSEAGTSSLLSCSSSSLSVRSPPIPCFPPHRFPQSVGEVRENYIAFLSVLRGEGEREKEGKMLKVPEKILEDIQVEDVYLYHRRAPLLEVFIFLIREHLPPPEELSLSMEFLLHHVPVDVRWLDPLCTVMDDSLSSTLNAPEVDLSGKQEDKNTRKGRLCPSSCTYGVSSFAYQRLSTCVAYECFLCKFLVSHLTLPDPATYQLPSDDCLVSGPLQAKFLFSPPSQSLYYCNPGSVSSTSSASLSPLLSSPFLAVEDPFVPRRSPPSSLFIPSVFPFLTNGVSLLRLAAKLCPPTLSAEAILSQERGKSALFKGRLHDECPRSRLLPLWRQCNLNPKTPLRCQVNIAVALQWLLTDEKGGWIFPKEGNCTVSDVNHSAKKNTINTTTTSPGESFTLGGKLNTFSFSSTVPRSENVLGSVPLFISKLATCIYQGDRLCLLQVLWSAVEYHRRHTHTSADAFLPNFVRTMNHVSSSSLSENISNRCGHMMSKFHPPGNSADCHSGQSTSQKYTSRCVRHSRDRPPTNLAGLHSMKELSSPVQASTKSQPRVSFNLRSSVCQDYSSLRTSKEQSHSLSLSVSSCSTSSFQRIPSSHWPNKEVEVQSQERSSVEAVENVRSVSFSTTSRTWVAQEVQGLTDWFLSVVGGARFHYEARDRSFSIRGSVFDIPIPILSPTPSSNSSPKCLIFSDGVVLAHTIRVLERRRCDALNCVKPPLKRAAKLFNISRCIRFLQDDCGVSSPVLWVLEEPLLDGDVHAVLSLIKILKQHYCRGLKNQPSGMEEK